MVVGLVVILLFWLGLGWGGLAGLLPFWTGAVPMHSCSRRCQSLAITL